MRIRHEYLRELRLRFGKTQNEIAEEAGVDIRTYRKYETGEICNISDKSVRASQYEFLRNLAACYDLQGGPEELMAPDRPPVTPPKPLPVLPTTGRFIPVRYVNRPREEARALRRLERAGTPVVVQAPERFGATRFLGYLVTNATTGSTTKLTIRVNLARLLVLAATTGSSLLIILGEHILQKTCRDSGLAEERARLFRQFPAVERGKLSWLLEKYVLPTADRVYLAIEHADAAIGEPAYVDFFVALRSWTEAADSAPWNRLRLLVSISTEPTIVEHGGHSSFFDMASPIRLEEFERTQLVQMAALEGNLRPAAIDKLIEWIGGNPYLARLAMQAASERELDMEVLLGDEKVRLSVFAHHLMSLRLAVESQPRLPKILSDLISRASSPAHPALEDYFFLYKKGLVVEEQTGAWRIRCRLYEEYFRSLYREPSSSA